MKGKKENTPQRLNPKFNEELKAIQEQRKNLGKNGNSFNDLTGLIVKHNFWEQIKEEMLEYDFK